MTLLTVGSMKTMNSWPSVFEGCRPSPVGELQELLKNAGVPISNADISSSLIRLNSEFILLQIFSDMNYECALPCRCKVRTL